jgi:Effector-associated domain 1
MPLPAIWEMMGYVSRLSKMAVLAGLVVAVTGLTLLVVFLAGQGLARAGLWASVLSLGLAAVGTAASVWGIVAPRPRDDQENGPAEAKRHVSFSVQQELSGPRPEPRYHADAGERQTVLARPDPQSVDSHRQPTTARERLSVAQEEPAPRSVRSEGWPTDIDMTAQDWNRLLDTMGSVFDSRTSAFNVLDRIDFPRSRRPFFDDNPLDSWMTIFNALDNGIIPAPRRRLLLAASTVYPFNPVFRELCERYGVVIAR